MNMLLLLAVFFLHIPIVLFALWVMFVVVMTMDQLRDAGRLVPGMIRFGESFASVGLVLDVYCNLIPSSVVFFEPPTEATVSARLRRLVVGEPSLRRTRLARWFAVTLMNPFCPPDRPHIPIPD
jgi:hypothetical protein